MCGNLGPLELTSNPLSRVPKVQIRWPQEKAGERSPSHRLESNYGASAIALEQPLAWLSPCASSQEQARYATVLAPWFRQPAFLPLPVQSTGPRLARTRSESTYPWFRPRETRYGWHPTWSDHP